MLGFLSHRVQTVRVYWAENLKLFGGSEKRTNAHQHGLPTHDGEVPNSLPPKFKSQSQISIWDVDMIPKMLQNLSAQFVCPSPKVLGFNKKRLH